VLAKFYVKTVMQLKLMKAKTTLHDTDTQARARVTELLNY
jgi:hypothetical protein